MRKSHFTETVVPVSGGIDSALVLAIAADAVGPAHVRAYNLPSQYNSDTTRSIAERLSCALGVRYGVIPISSIDEDVRATFERHAHKIERSLTRENLHARIRGLLMMAEFERHRRASAVVRERDRNRARLCDAVRGHVRRHLGDRRSVQGRRLPPGPVRQHSTRPRDIRKRPSTLKPSAELAPGQVDPFDYYVMAPVVSELAERRRSVSELIALFETKSLDPARFGPDPDGRTVNASTRSKASGRGD